jgi:hypothetical protein
MKSTFLSTGMLDNMQAEGARDSLITSESLIAARLA